MRRHQAVGGKISNPLRRGGCSHCSRRKATEPKYGETQQIWTLLWLFWSAPKQGMFCQRSTSHSTGYISRAWHSTLGRGRGAGRVLPRERSRHQVVAEHKPGTNAELSHLCGEDTPIVREQRPGCDLSLQENYPQHKKGGFLLNRESNHWEQNRPELFTALLNLRGFPHSSKKFPKKSSLFLSVSDSLRREGKTQDRQ